MKNKIPSFFTVSVMVIALIAAFPARLPAQSDNKPLSNTMGVYQPVQQQCGTMLGGIGTGFLELYPDGCIHDWSIFNRGPWGYRGDFFAVSPKDRLALTEMNQDSLQFYVRACPQGGKPVLRRLSTIGSQMNVYGGAWMQNVDGIAFDQTFPGATLRYDDPILPVKVSGQFYGPVIPHDMKTSGTPGFYAVFTIKNDSKETQDVSLAGYLRNPLSTSGDVADRGAEARKLHTSVVTDQGTTYLTMRTESNMVYKSTLGTICLSINGGESSWIAMDFREFLMGRTLDLKPWNQRYETWTRGFRANGQLPNTSEQPCPNKLGPLVVGGAALPQAAVVPDFNTGKSVSLSADVAKLTEDEVRQIIDQAGKVPSLQSVLAQAKAVDPSLLDPAKNGRLLCDILRQAVSQYSGVDGKAQNWGDSMLSTKITLKPGEQKQVRVVLSWYFPSHPSPDNKRNMGHMYANWFKDAEEVNRFLVKDYTRISDKVAAFHKIFQDSNLPPTLLTSIADQMTTLICSTWWTQDDKMGIWEGLGSCGLNSATCIEEGSHPLVALFPDLEKKWTYMATQYQNDKTGRIYILLPSDLDKGSKNQGYGYVDRNCQYIWAICRDYLWMGNKQYLDTYYPSVVKAMGVFEGMDTDGDGLPDIHTESNTYDTWALQGVPSYFCSIWISALRCGIRMAHDAGDTANETKWQGILDKATKSFNEKLWNGDYYSLWIDGKERDEACMTDQLAGEFFTGLMGLSGGIQPDRVQKVLEAVYKYNYDPDQGVWNAAYPPGTKPHMPTYQNVQADSTWPGIEYNMASMLIDHGMVDQGLSIVEALQRRYYKGARFMNAEECGPHYIRALSVWSLLLAATGFKIDVPQGILTIAPPLKQPEIRAPWVSSTGWGEFKKTDSTFDLSCSDGEVSFKELRLNVGALSSAQLAGTRVKFTAKSENGLTVLHFDQPITVKEGQTLALK